MNLAHLPSFPPGFAAGGLSVASIIAAVFFLKFWRRTHDGLFLAFAAAFVLMAVNQAGPVLLGIPSEEASKMYIFRFAAFLVIIFAIIWKNFARRS